MGSGPVVDLLPVSLSGGTAVLFTYPLDLVRTKLAYQLKLCRSISYVTVAAHADHTSRRKLALFQVPLLLGIGEEDTVLTKATESGDIDLVYLVLFHIWQKRPALELFGMIQARPIAHDLFIRDSRYHILAWLEALEETRIKQK
ncbi:unnamed protein product [Lactuca saligna]|uniref:Vps16 C-terminal domain-containing protein n=1 Tax=Lactuca saligna TaxID=75948 RepID=A0AA36E2R6_LACSI|nr:unnamed protein product [Lactuca saligna]